MDFLRYANQGAVRNQPLAPDLAQALAFLPELGVEVEVFSGGQPAKGSGGGRVGSTRHDHGNAADVFFYKDGRRLDWNNPDDVPVFQQIVSRGKQSGLTGFGAGQGYMQPGSMHIGFGTPAVWGAGGKGDNAPQWLREAYYGGSAPQPNSAPTQTPTVSTRGQNVGGLMGLLGNQQQQPMQGQPAPQTADGLLGMMFPNMSADRADKIRLGMLGATTRPNQAAMAGIIGGMEGRQRTAAEQRKMQQAQEMQAQQQQEEARRKAMALKWIIPNLGEEVAQGYINNVFDNSDIAALWKEKQGGGKQPTPYTDMAKLQADLNSGLITQDQYNAAVSGSGEGLDVEGESKLRKEYTSLPQVKEFQDQVTAFDRIRQSAADPSAAGDMALVFNFMKLLDPGSTVREGEFASAQQAAGVPERVVGLYNKVLSGELLTPAQREDFVSRAEKLYSGAESQNTNLSNTYLETAQEYGYNPERSVPDFRLQRGIDETRPQSRPGSTAPAGLPQVKTDADFDALPSGALFIAPDGTQRRKP